MGNATSIRAFTQRDKPSAWLVEWKNPVSDRRGFFHAPATPAPNSAPTGNVRLGRVGFKQMETLAGWNGPAHPLPRRAHRERSWSKEPSDRRLSRTKSRNTGMDRGTHQRAQFAERPKGSSPYPQKIVMAHRQPIQRTYLSWGKPKVAADANCLTIPTEVPDMRHRYAAGHANQASRYMGGVGSLHLYEVRCHRQHHC